MKFDHTRKTLYAEDGSVLKELNCPIQKNWDSLVVDHATPFKRYCNSCSKSVIDITGFNEKRVRELLEIDATSCLCIKNESKYIDWIFNEQPNGAEPQRNICQVGEELLVEGCRLVLTARSHSQISSNKKRYITLIKPIHLDEEINECVRLTDNKNGYSHSPDPRTHKYDGSEIYNTWHPLISTHPFAAYLVPYDAEEGERFFIPDVIEDIVGHRHNTYKYRISSGFGTYKDKDIEIEPPPSVLHVSG